MAKNVVLGVVQVGSDAVEKRNLGQSHNIHVNQADHDESSHKDGHKDQDDSQNDMVARGDFGGNSSSGDSGSLQEFLQVGTNVRSSMSPSGFESLFGNLFSLLVNVSSFLGDEVVVTGFADNVHHHRGDDGNSDEGRDDGGGDFEDHGCANECFVLE